MRQSATATESAPAARNPAFKAKKPQEVLAPEAIADLEGFAARPACRAPLYVCAMLDKTDAGVYECWQYDVTIQCANGRPQRCNECIMKRGLLTVDSEAAE